MKKIIFKIRFFINNVFLLGLNTLLVKIFSLTKTETDHRRFIEINSKLFNIKVKEINIKIKKYAKKHPKSIVLNSNIFNVYHGESLGPLVIDNKFVNDKKYVDTDNGHSISYRQCYPLIIDNNKLFTLALNRLDKENSIDNLVNYQYALCGWGCLYENGNPRYEFIDEDIRWGKKRAARQIIGTLRNGNFFILTTANSTYETIFKCLSNKKVNFAYSLDGGRSTNLFIKGKRGSKLLKGVKERTIIPTIIEFEPKK